MNEHFYYKPANLSKERKQQLNQLTYQSNRLKGAYSFGRIKNLNDILLNWGLSKQDIASKYFPSELQSKITLHDINEFISDRFIELTTEYYLQDFSPQITLTESELAIQQKNSVTITEVQKSEDNEEEIDQLQLKNIKVKFPKFQQYAILDIINRLTVRKDTAVLVSAGTGTGKTFIAGGFIKWLLQTKYCSDKTMSPWPIVYVTKPSILIQTQRVFENQFLIKETDCLVTSYDQLRSKFGELMLTQELRVQDGVEFYEYKWRKFIHPMIIIWDECHSLKNESSQQSQIGQAYNEIEDYKNTFQVFLSATPGTRVADFKCLAVATRVPYTFGLQKNAPLTNNHWADFAKNIATDYGTYPEIKPEDHYPKAVDRLMDYLDKYVYRVKGVRPQFKAYNTVQLIEFGNEKYRKQYDEAWENFLQKMAKMNAAKDAAGEEYEAKNYVNILSMLLVFRLAAESNDDRCEKIAAAMYDAVTNHNQAAIAALNFKIPICKIVNILVTKYKVKRDDICLIWGGAPKENKKSVLKNKILNNHALLEQMKQQGVSLSDLGIADDIEAKEELNLDPSLRLGNQNAKERQREIDKFQKGIAHYCLYTFRAGGVGLSLHHTDEFTKEKVRKRRSNYAFEEDIKKIPTRQRICFVAPTWSAIEMVQGLGRAPRLFSLSDTNQILMYYKNTIEERVAKVVSIKLHCLSKVVRTHEDYMDIAIKHTDETVADRYISNSVVDEIEEAENNGVIDVSEEELEEVSA